MHDWRMTLPEPWRTVLDFDTVVGAFGGAGVGFWAASSHTIESSETGDLYALAGAAVGLLVAALAVLALLTGFLSRRTAYIIRNREGGTDAFFRSFKVVVIVTGISIVACVIGAVDASSSTLTKTGTERRSIFLRPRHLVLPMGRRRRHVLGEQSSDTAMCAPTQKRECIQRTSDVPLKKTSSKDRVETPSPERVSSCFQSRGLAGRHRVGHRV